MPSLFNLLLLKRRESDLDDTCRDRKENRYR